jgi:hypothetical protein
MIKRKLVGLVLTFGVSVTAAAGEMPNTLAVIDEVARQLGAASGEASFLGAQGQRLLQSEPGLQCPELPDLTSDKSWGEDFVAEELRVTEEAAKCLARRAPLLQAYLSGIAFEATKQGKSAFEIQMFSAPATNLVKSEVQGGEDQTKGAKNNSSFMGLNWGLGVGVSLGFDETVSQASIINDQIVATETRRNEPRVVLEFHKYIQSKRRNELILGHGPFVAVAATSQNVLSGVGFGWTFGFQTSPRSTEGFTIGIGAILDADVKDLAAGFTLGEAPPAGETAVTFEEKARWSALIFVTRNLFGD